LGIERGSQGFKKANTAERVAKPCGRDVSDTEHVSGTLRVTEVLRERAFESGYAVGPKSSSEALGG
jgi:hypothetical protein